MKLTPWFDGKQKPVRPGVYRRLISEMFRQPIYSQWNGAYWCTYSSNASAAAEYTLRSVFQDNRPWRGVLK